MDRSEEAVESVNPRNKGYQLLILRNMSEVSHAPAEPNEKKI